MSSASVVNSVAKQLGEDPRQFASSVGALPDESLNGLRIIAVAKQPERAVKLADAFSAALTASLDQRTQDSKNKQVRQQEAVITQLQQTLAAAPALSQQAVDLQNQLNQAQSDLATIQSQSPSASGFSTLQAATASPQSESTSRTARLAIGGVMGLLLGIVVALVLTRFDTRIRTKEMAEDVWGVPVLAEVPPLTRRDRSRRAIVAVNDPESFSAEVYRGLRTALVVASHVGMNQNGAGGDSESRIVLVASPGMGEGKTTTAANLAVAFAESGRRVLLLGCDLRRPELHNYLGVPATPGLTHELAKPPAERSLANIIQDTAMSGVQIAPSGDPIEHPGELLTRGLDLIRSARVSTPTSSSSTRRPSSRPTTPASSYRWPTRSWSCAGPVGRRPPPPPAVASCWIVSTRASSGWC